MLAPPRAICLLLLCIVGDAVDAVHVVVIAFIRQWKWCGKQQSMESSQFHTWEHQTVFAAKMSLCIYVRAHYNVWFSRKHRSMIRNSFGLLVQRQCSRWARRKFIQFYTKHVLSDRQFGLACSPTVIFIIGSRPDIRAIDTERGMGKCSCWTKTVHPCALSTRQT